MFGGGTDYEKHFSQYSSLVLGFAIKKFVYTTLRYTPKFFNHRTSVHYSKAEHVDDNTLIQNAPVRGSLQYKGITDGLEISHMADIFGKSGLGSSSAFIVGILNSLNQLLHDEAAPKMTLAEETIHIEQNILKEKSGIQDGIWSSHGGVNSIEISKDGNFKVKPLPVTQEFLQQLNNNLVLFYTGGTRKSFEVAISQDTKTAESFKKQIQQIAHEALAAFVKEDMVEIGKLLDESWQQKRKTSTLISTPKIDDLYNHAKRHSMIGGKILGAGGGGFMLCFTENRRKLIKNMDLFNTEFSFDFDGSKIILS